MNVSLGTGNNLLARLNKEQIEAVTQDFGPSLIIAGAGSGKTTVLTRRIAALLTHFNQDAESVLSVTFTNKAAAEMKQRVQLMLGESRINTLAIGTFHSICARLLRKEIESYETAEGWHWSSNFVIYDETDSVNTLKSQIAKLNLDEKVYSAKEIKHAISSIKNDGLSAGRFASQAKTHRENRLAEIFAHYQGELARNNALDFDDLILIFSELLRSNNDVLTRQHKRFRHILVDEFQDTNKAQYELIRMLATGSARNRRTETDEQDDKERSLMVVGDVDQSIYSWRKADFRIILGFQNDFPESRLIKLEENYRSTAVILNVANSIIAHNSERLEKVLRCNRGEGSKVQVYEAADEIDEAYYIVEEIKRLRAKGRNLSEVVILYRTNAQSRAIEEILVRSQIPYTLVGGTRFYERQEIKDTLAYLKLIYNDKDSQAFLRVINTPRRGIGKVTLERLYDYAVQNNISLVEASIRCEEIADIGNKARQSLKDFGLLVRRWQAIAQASLVSVLLEVVLKESKYLDTLEEEARSTKDELILGRLDNIGELLAVAKEFESIAENADLETFLTRISLVSDLDGMKDEQSAVTLMTLHSAKGLEFPAVFLMGLEDGLFPHIRSFDSPAAMEEERRLMYVGVTRAADLLYMTLARRRMFLGRFANNGSNFSNNQTTPSRFLKEITPDLLIGFYPHPEREQNDWGQSEPKDIRYSNTDRQRDSGSPRSRGEWRDDTPKKAFTNFGQTVNNGTGTNNRTGITNHAQRDFGKTEQYAGQLYVPLKMGDLVQHNKFGIGQIVQIIGEKNKELYNVDFKEAGKRLLDPRFAKLIKIS